MSEKESPYVSEIDFPDERSDQYVEVHLENCPLCLVNSFRRFIMDDLITLAITNVTFEKNNSYIHNELLAHRFELLPVRLREGIREEDVDLEKPVATFECKGNIDGAVTLMNSQETVQSDVVESVFNCEMNQLFYHQQVKGTFRIGYGTGKEHAKFCPVSAISFRNKDESSGDNSTRWVLCYEGVGTFKYAEDIFYQAVEGLMKSVRELRNCFEEL